jgi:hypothetical protein
LDTRFFEPQPHPAEHALELTATDEISGQRKTTRIHFTLVPLTQQQLSPTFNIELTRRHTPSATRLLNLRAHFPRNHAHLSLNDSTLLYNPRTGRVSLAAPLTHSRTIAINLFSAASDLVLGLIRLNVRDG